MPHKCIIQYERRVYVTVRCLSVYLRVRSSVCPTACSRFAAVSRQVGHIDGLQHGRRRSGTAPQHAAHQQMLLLTRLQLT